LLFSFSFISRLITGLGKLNMFLNPISARG